MVYTKKWCMHKSAKPNANLPERKGEEAIYATLPIGRHFTGRRAVRALREKGRGFLAQSLRGPLAHVVKEIILAVGRRMCLIWQRIGFPVHRLIIPRAGSRKKRFWKYEVRYEPVHSGVTSTPVHIFTRQPSPYAIRSHMHKVTGPLVIATATPSFWLNPPRD
jgi:hypothetical protein